MGSFTKAVYENAAGEKLQYRIHFPDLSSFDPISAETKLPLVLFFHGADADPVVPVSRSREMMAAIANQGHSGELRYTEVPGMKHDSWTATYSAEEAFEWLFRQAQLVH